MGNFFCFFAALKIKQWNNRTLSTFIRCREEKRRLSKTIFRRSLYRKINWENRLIGIKGCKGVEETTLMLQHMKEAFPDRSKALYVSLEGLYDSHPCSLAELIERHEDIAADVLFHQNVVMHSNKYLLFQKFFCKLNFCVFL